MDGRRFGPRTLFALAAGLGLAFFAATLGVWAPLRQVGDLLAVLAVGGAVVAAGVNGYRGGNVAVSLGATSLLAGGHLLGTWLRDARASRLAPVPPRYYALAVAVAVGAGVGAHLVGRWVDADG